MKFGLNIRNKMEISDRQKKTTRLQAFSRSTDQNKKRQKVKYTRQMEQENVCVVEYYRNRITNQLSLQVWLQRL